MADYDKLLQVPRGTKARLEEIKLDLLVNTIVYATDTKELGIKLSDGNIEYFMNATDINAIVDALETSKQDKLVAGTNITIDENTNMISATGNIGITVDWEDVEDKPELYNVDEIEYILSDATQWVNGKLTEVGTFMMYLDESLTGVEGKVSDVENGKQDKLVAGDNITIDRNNVISASGVESYNDLTDKPAIPTKVGDLINDKGYITGYTETDPIFTAWDKSTGISITKSQVSDLIEATQSISGLMSATDKTRLDALHALLEEDTENNVVDSINEVLAIFNNYPEGADLVTALAGKVDKVKDKGLSTNDLTNALKSNYDTAYSWGNHATENYLKSITKAMVEAVLTGTITTHNHDGVYEPSFTKNSAFNKNFGTTAGTVTQGNDSRLSDARPASDVSDWAKKASLEIGDIPTGITGTTVALGNHTHSQYLTSFTESDPTVPSHVKGITTANISSWNEKQDKLVAGDNITIDPNTNVISTSGGGGGGSAEVDLDEMVYFDFAGRIYGARNNILLSAWAHSLTVDPLEISADSEFSPPKNRGRAQYPNEVTEGIIIPRGVTTIGKYAFAHAYGNNQPLIIPNSVTHIGYGAFHAWSINNHPLVIPDGVIEIGQHAFNSWSVNNQPVTISNSVTSIGDWAFRDWSSAKEFIMESETPPTITRNSFYNTNDAPFYVPNNRVQTYKTATNWSALADRIYPISDRTSGEGGIPEAPLDGKLYGRTNATWSEITAPEDALRKVVTLLEIDLFGGTAGIPLYDYYMTYTADVMLNQDDVNGKILIINAFDVSYIDLLSGGVQYELTNGYDFLFNEATPIWQRRFGSSGSDGDVSIWRYE